MIRLIPLTVGCHCAGAAPGAAGAQHGPDGEVGGVAAGAAAAAGGRRARNSGAIHTGGAAHGTEGVLAEKVRACEQTVIVYRVTLELNN